MSNDIRIKKGLDIKLKGAAEKTLETAVLSNFFTLRPEDFHGVTPKLISKVGTKVKAGEPVFYDKANENVKFVSPVSGEIIEFNDSLESDPEKVNTDPYGDGWMVKIKFSNPEEVSELLDSDAYKALIGA